MGQWQVHCVVVLVAIYGCVGAFSIPYSFTPRTSLLYVPLQQQHPCIDTTQPKQELPSYQYYSKRQQLTRLRGGASSLSFVRTGFVNFANYIGRSRVRCLLLLLTSICFESFATALSKRAKDTGSVITFLKAICVYTGCMVGFNVSLAKIDVSVAYALWSAVGTLLVTAAGTLFFGEKLGASKVVCLLLIVAGVVGLNVQD